MADYFKHLADLLLQERAADETSFKQLTSSTNSAQRRDAGLSWYPIAIRNTEPTRGNYLSIEVERTTHKDLSHQIRFGSSVALFSNYDMNDRVNGTVTYLGADRMRITLLTDELPDWADKGKLGIDLEFDAYSYDEMRSALKQAAASTSDLVKVMTGNAETANLPLPLAAPYLNLSQQAAVQNILGCKHVAVVHGPPGTGKTTTLITAIQVLIEQGELQILVVAPSNTAVDLLTSKLLENGIDVLRIGNPVRVGQDLQRSTLESRMGEHAQMKDAKKLRKQAAEYKNMAHKYKRSFGKAEKEQRKALFDEAHRIMRDVTKIEEFVAEDVISKAQVITATLVGSDHHSVSQRKYNTVIIDEAGQALETGNMDTHFKGQQSCPGR